MTYLSSISALIAPLNYIFVIATNKFLSLNRYYFNLKQKPFLLARRQGDWLLTRPIRPWHRLDRNLEARKTPPERGWGGKWAEERGLSDIVTDESCHPSASFRYRWPGRAGFGVTARHRYPNPLN